MESPGISMTVDQNRLSVQITPCSDISNVIKYKNVRCIRSVSYTHLDLVAAAGSGISCVESARSSAYHENFAGLRSGSQFSQAVSYTHLKRLGKRNFPSRIRKKGIFIMLTAAGQRSIL